MVLFVQLQLNIGLFFFQFTDDSNGLSFVVEIQILDERISFAKLESGNLKPLN